MRCVVKLFMNGLLFRWVCASCLVILGTTSPLTCTLNGAETSTEGDGEFQIGPDYKIDPDLTDRGNPKGKSFEFAMPLADSKIFHGDDPTLLPDKKPVRKERVIYVY